MESPDSPPASGRRDGDRDPKRRRSPDDGACEDLLSGLPDDLLVVILQRTDPRTAVSTAALSRRWRRLDPARCFAAFDLSVASHLPPEYSRTVALYRVARCHDNWSAQEGMAERVGHCEDRAMEAYVRGLACFLRAPERFPGARSLRLEFLITPLGAGHEDAGRGDGMAACLACAVRWPGLEQLAVETVPRAATGKSRQPPDLFPESLLGAPPPLGRLATLHVKNCLLAPSGHGYGAFPALSRLTLEVTARVAVLFESGYLNDLMGACQQLVSLRLISCNPSGVGDGQQFTVDLPPASRLRELIMETCNYGEVRLVNAPSLEKLVLEKSYPMWSLWIENAPRLETLVCRRVVPLLHGDGTANLRFVELWVVDPSEGEDRLSSFFSGIPNVEELSLCFRGRLMWIEPEHFSNSFDNLKKLSIDLLRMWPLHWIKQPVEVAACLEKLYIQIFAPSSETSELVDTAPPYEGETAFEHTYLKEIEMVGFEGTGQQMALIRFFMSSCRALKTVFLIRHRALLEEKLDQQGRISSPSWLMEDERAEIVSQLRDGIRSDAEIILG